MKLVYNKKSKDPFLYIQHGYRIDGKVKTVTICKLGKYSELAKEHDDPFKYAESVLQKYNKDYNSIKNDEKGKKLDKTNNKICNSNVLNIGYFYLQYFYSKLKIKDFIDELSETRKFTFNLNDITRFIVFDRILNPKSKLSTLKDLSHFYEKPIIEYQHVLQGIDVLAENYDKYLKHLFINSNNIVTRDTSICYYNCTNYYFEIEEPDIYIDEVTGEEITGLRQYGPSKEHRPNPIVEMGLFMDKDGIPISMGIFSGNMNEQKTVSGIETKMIKSLKKKEFIYCGDAGLGSASIRAFNDMGGRAFIVTQSIKKLSEEFQKELLKDEGFKLFSNDKSITLKELKTFDKSKEENINLYEDKAYKSLIVDSNIDLGLLEEKMQKNGKIKYIKSKAALKQKIIITYSRKMAEYQKHIRNKQIERAKALIKKGVDDIRKGPNDISRFIMKEQKAKDVYILNEEKIAQEEKFDGFYALATNLLEDKEIDIININSERYKIEDCFRVLKTNFDARPVYHRLDNRITAHFMICYTSLLIYRLLKKKLKEKDYNFTINEILESLKSINVFQDEDKYKPIYEQGQFLDAMNDITQIDLDSTYFKQTYFKKIIKKIS